MPGNMQFVEDDESPYAQLELIQPVRAGEQLFADYGPTYAYSEHRFARFSGAGPALIADPRTALPTTVQAAYDDNFAQQKQNVKSWFHKHMGAPMY
eukprot:COSAG02_NODE_168_length_31711_cov_68.337973_2_plen_96_part_00